MYFESGRHPGRALRRQDREPDHRRVRPLDRDESRGAADVPQVGREVPHPHAQLQHAVVSI